MSLLELSCVEVAYGDLPALRGVSLAVEAGETLSVVGARMVLRVLESITMPASACVWPYCEWAWPRVATLSEWRFAYCTIFTTSWTEPGLSTAAETL